MTVLVGVLCSDGVVVGADGSATFTAGQMRTVEQRTHKLTVVHDHVIVAGTGAVGLNQRFARCVEVRWVDGTFGQHVIDVGKALCNDARTDFASTQAKPDYGALVAYATKDRPQLIEFPPGSLQPEFKDNRLWYVTMGSGQPILDPFLGLIRKVLWRDNMPTVREATFAVTWALEHAIDVNPGGIGPPISVGVVERQRGSFTARVLDDDELSEHLERLRSVEEGLRNLVSADDASVAAADDPPDLAGNAS